MAVVAEKAGVTSWTWMLSAAKAVPTSKRGQGAAPGTSVTGIQS
jgi:hypothetical protein